MLPRRILVPLLAVAAALGAAPPPDPEAAYRENNRGVALLEQFRHEEAVKAFEQALAIDPRSTLARINLAIARYNVPDLPGAEREARAALDAAPDAPQAHFILGLAARSQSRLD